MGCTRSRGSRGFHCLVCLPRPGEPGRYSPQSRENLNAGEIKQTQVIVDEASEYRLVLECVVVDIPDLENGGFGLDFYAVHLQSSAREGWQNDLTISQDDFLAGSDCRRWIAQLHSFDPRNQTAIIQTGTDGSPTGIGVVKYCWCEWDLVRNCLIRHIKTCDNPFDSLDG